MRLVVGALAFLLCVTGISYSENCPRPASGSVVEEPQELHSQNGVLEARLTAYNSPDAHDSVRYCYLDAGGP